MLTHDLRHREIIQTALRNYEVVRDKREARFRDWQSARQAAAETKWEAHQSSRQISRRIRRTNSKRAARKFIGPAPATQAREIILSIIREKKARSIIKSKAMTSEEIHLNDALETTGFEVVESDLGEFIVQLRHEAPYHIVFPAMHLTRGEISELFDANSAARQRTDPEELTMIARRVLRQKYISRRTSASPARILPSPRPA